MKIVRKKCFLFSFLEANNNSMVSKKHPLKNKSPTILCHFALKVLGTFDESDKMNDLKFHKVKIFYEGQISLKKSSTLF